MTVSRKTIVEFLNDYLEIGKIPDDSCDGLQVQGNPAVEKIGLCVDACMAVYRKAARKGCTMVIAHHGLIWKGLTSVSGTAYNHISFLLHNNISLYASHLPLDLHPEVGNNARLSAILGLTKRKSFGNYHGTDIGFKGKLAEPLTIDELAAILEKKLNTAAIKLPFGKKQIKTVGVVSGGAPNELSQAIEQGLDCYITGEGSHWNHHAALEAKINVIYAGHYATETVGVKALGRLLEKKFDVKTIFIDEPTIL